MAAGRGATPTLGAAGQWLAVASAKGRCSGCCSHGTGAQPETGPSEGALWPSRGGGAPALPGEGDHRGQSSQDRAGQTRRPWTRRCPTQLRVNRLVTGRSSSGCAFFLTSVGVLTNRKARAHLCACTCPGPVQPQASGDHGSPALGSSPSLPRPCCWVIPGTLWRLWVRAGACLLPRRGHVSGLASDIWTLPCRRSGRRVGQQTLLAQAQQPRLLLCCPFQSDPELQL